MNALTIARKITFFYMVIGYRNRFFIDYKSLILPNVPEDIVLQLIRDYAFVYSIQNMISPQIGMRG